MTEKLADYLEVWERKPVLRTVYGGFYDRIAAVCVPGITIEIGGGIGNLKERLPQVFSTDIQHGPWLDCVADAQRLPFASDAVANIVMVDVLHHLEFPLTFFREAERALRRRGRIVMIEPAITWVSTLFYRFFHPEPVRMLVDPFFEGDPNPKRDPYDANQAIPTLIATRHRDRLGDLVPGLAIERVDWFSLAVYPLSGGFKKWSLIPAAVARHALRAERTLEPLIGRFSGFRMMLVVEKLGNET